MGHVVGLDAAQHLPLLLVASSDGCVRVYDWVRCSQLAVRHMGARQPLSCSLHPSGLMAAVGTNEALAVFWILKVCAALGPGAEDAAGMHSSHGMLCFGGWISRCLSRHRHHTVCCHRHHTQGNLSPMADLPVAKCNVARYSHTGGLLAAAGSSNTIYVYPAYYGHEGAAGRASSTRPAAHTRSLEAAASGAVLEAVAVLKGHVSSVTDVVFTGDNRRLVSTGAGGAVYFWDLCTGSRLVELEYVDKKCLYTSGATC